MPGDPPDLACEPRGERGTDRDHAGHRLRGWRCELHPRTQPAEQHGETGWRAHAFPLSVDGIEIVASLVLLADRRAGRRSGWPPWAALAAGTLASVAANVAVGGSDLIGRTVAGWPAFALLVAIKLLSGLLEPRLHAAAVPDHRSPDDPYGANPGPAIDSHHRPPGTPGSARRRAHRMDGRAARI